MNANQFMDLLETVGIPAAFAVGAGWMVWKLFQHLIADVHKKLDVQHSMIVALIDRVRQMDNDMIRIDSMCRTVLGVQVDVDRIARADGKKDQRKDWYNRGHTSNDTNYNSFNSSSLCIRFYVVIYDSN